MNPLLKDLLESLDKTHRPIDKDLVIKAWEFANLAHIGQKRLSGEAFITHPTQVAKTLAHWNLDTTTIVSGLLHDTVEDGGATKADLLEIFGPEVSNLVEGVTKVTGVHLKGSDQEQFAENLRKMLLVMASDLRVVLVKLADRLHNMQTLQYLPPEDQANNSKETLEIYAPLADRLGMSEIKGQLEDLAFKYSYPSEYQELVKQTADIYKKSQAYVEKFRRKLLTLLKTQIPSTSVNIRVKRLYSLFRKLQRPDKSGDITKIHDLVAARVLVNTPDECYIAVGLIHRQFHPVPYLNFRDYIATPKPNGYKSIHTNVFGPEGKIVEIQIRTYDMHSEAEMGIAAHWQMAELKSKGKLSSEDIDKGNFTTSGDKLAWVRQLMSWQKEISDNQEYLNTLKFDALRHRNLVFSPKGDVFDLPYGATPIDFAYAVHTGLGHQASGAKVNGKLVSLHHHLINGDVVEIIIDRKRLLPSHEWLNFVVTTAARREIHKALKS